MSLFVKDVLTGWDGHIKMQNVLNDDGSTRLDYRELIGELPCGDEKIPIKRVWNGATVKGILRWLFPKWKHPIATCRHDERCDAAVTKEERKFADKEFKAGVKRGGTKWEEHGGYVAVRLGAWWKGVKGDLI